MTERQPRPVHPHCPAKMEASDLSNRKMIIVFVIVGGCFAVLWPNVFYPMLMGSAEQRLQPSAVDKAAGCCDVISETDVNTIEIMSELCGSIIKSQEGARGAPSGRELVEGCKKEIQRTCGIDVSAVLQERVRLGDDVKHILAEIRSLNGSLCLKYNYGVAPWRLGVPHRVTINVAPAANLRQERPMHLRSEMIHPAFRERGRAIPHAGSGVPPRPPPRIVEGRPGPVPGMRPTIGGAGHVVPPAKQGSTSMSIIMPIYTIGIVIFFTYTLMKILFKKQPDVLYPPVEPDPHFRREVFESERARFAPRMSRENIAGKLVVNAMSALLEEVDQEIEARQKAYGGAQANGTVSNGVAHNVQEDQSRVTVLGMETTASREDGQRWPRPEPPPPAPAPPNIYLEGALPPQSQLLVADSATEAQPNAGRSPAVVLAGKMTLSVISVDSSDENDNETSMDIKENSPESVVVDQIDDAEVTQNTTTKTTEDDNSAQLEIALQTEQKAEAKTTEELPDVTADDENKSNDEDINNHIQNIGLGALEKSVEDTLMENLSRQIEKQQALLDEAFLTDTESEDTSNVKDEPEKPQDEAKQIARDIDEIETEEEAIDEEVEEEEEQAEEEEEEEEDIEEDGDEMEIEEICYESEDDGQEDINENEIRNYCSENGVNENEETKYSTTISSGTVAENDISEDEVTEEETDEEETDNHITNDTED